MFGDYGEFPGYCERNVKEDTSIEGNEVSPERLKESIVTQVIYFFEDKNGNFKIMHFLF